jgi:vitamin B12 transporter
MDLHLRPELRASVTVFQRRDTNVIDYVRASPADLWQATNFDKLHFTGVEASANYEPVAGQHISLSYAALHGVNSGETVLLSKYAFNYPVQSAVVEWRGNIAGRVIARTRIGVADQLNRTPYAVWDASATWSQGRFRPFLQLTNLTSTVYQEIPSVALPKRGVMGGVEFVFRGM